MGSMHRSEFLKEARELFPEITASLDRQYGQLHPEMAVFGHFPQAAIDAGDRARVVQFAERMLERGNRGLANAVTESFLEDLRFEDRSASAPGALRPVEALHHAGQPDAGALHELPRRLGRAVHLGADRVVLQLADRAERESLPLSVGERIERMLQQLRPLRALRRARRVERRAVDLGERVSPSVGCVHRDLAAGVALDGSVEVAPIAQLSERRREEPAPERRLALVLEAIGVAEDLATDRLRDVAHRLASASARVHAEADECA